MWRKFKGHAVFGANTAAAGSNFKGRGGGGGGNNSNNSGKKSSVVAAATAAMGQRGQMPMQMPMHMQPRGPPMMGGSHLPPPGAYARPPPGNYPPQRQW